MKKCIFIILILSGLFYSLYSQPKPEWRNFVALAGRSIAVDPFRDGVIWIAGSGGLIRYDSHSNCWRSFTTAEGLSKIWGRSVFVDEDYIWVGTEGSGANIFDLKNERFTSFLQFSFSPANPEYRPTVNVIIPGGDVIWVGTDYGLFSVDPISLDTLQRFTKEDGLGDNYVYSIIDDGQYLWLATASGGGYIWPPDTGGLSRLTKSTNEIHNFTFWERPGDNWFRSIADTDDNIWVAGSPRLLIFDKETELFSTVLEDVIYGPQTVIADEEDLWCIGRWQDGKYHLFRIDRSRRTLKESVTIPSFFYGASITVDASDIYMVGDNQFYVSSKDVLDFAKLDTDAHFLPDRFCHAVSGDNQRLYAGCADFIVMIDKEEPLSMKMKNVPVMNGSIRGITVDGDNLWIGTNNGLHRFDVRNFVFKDAYLNSHGVYFTVIDDEYVWASSRPGLYRIDKVTGVKTHRSLSDDLNSGIFMPSRIRSIVLDDDVVWISFSGQQSDSQMITGIIKLDRTTLNTLAIKKVEIERFADAIEPLIDFGAFLLAGGKEISLISKRTLSIEPVINQRTSTMALSESKLWVIDPDVGVRLFDTETKKEKLFLNESNGLLHNIVTDIFVSDEYISFSTYGGISSLKISSRIWIPVTTTVYLYQNYPNPFNSSTNIVFSLPAAMNVNLNVYDILGRRVTARVDRFMEEGVHSKTFDAGNLSSGVYFYRLEAGGMSEVRKMIYLR